MLRRYQLLYMWVLLMTIYYYGCRCGSVAKQIQAVQKLHPEVYIKNTKYDKEARMFHAAQLLDKNLIKDYYPAIVVDGDNVVLLSQWQS